MTELVVGQELGALVGPEAASRAQAIYTAVSAALEKVARHVDPIAAAAFLVGALAMVACARLALFGAALLVGAEFALVLGLIPTIPAWLEPLAFSLLAAGLVQGGLTLVLGEQTANTVLSAAVLGGLLFLLWRAPARTVRGLGLFASRMRNR